MANPTYADLQKQLAELEKEAQKTRDLLASRSNEEIKVLVDALAKKLQAQGLDIHTAVEELRKYAPSRRGHGAVKPSAKAEAKYQGPNGETWSGKGRSPKWMQVALDAGKSKEDLLIN